MLTEVAASIVAGADAVLVRQAHSYREARRQQREEARGARDRALGWSAMAARAAGAFMARNMQKSTKNQIFIDEVRDGD